MNPKFNSSGRGRIARTIVNVALLGTLTAALVACQGTVNGTASLNLGVASTTVNFQGKWQNPPAGSVLQPLEAHVTMEGVQYNLFKDEQGNTYAWVPGKGYLLLEHWQQVGGNTTPGGTGQGTPQDDPGSGFDPATPTHKDIAKSSRVRTINGVSVGFNTNTDQAGFSVPISQGMTLLNGASYHVQAQNVNGIWTVSGYADDVAIYAMAMGIQSFTTPPTTIYEGGVPIGTAPAARTTFVPNVWMPVYSNITGQPLNFEVLMQWQITKDLSGQVLNVEPIAEPIR